MINSSPRDETLCTPLPCQAGDWARGWWLGLEVVKARYFIWKLFFKVHQFSGDFLPFSLKCVERGSARQWNVLCILRLESGLGSLSEAVSGKLLLCPSAHFSFGVDWALLFQRTPDLQFYIL